jgi:hypothetical protein
MNKKKILTALAAVLCCAAMFSSCKKVNPETELLNFNPLLQWGCSLADVERHIQGKDWWQDGNDQPEYWEDPYQCWHKWYWVDATNEITEQYLFETEDGRNLRYALSCSWNKNVTADQFASTLKHKGFRATGEMVDFDGDYYKRFLLADGKTEALLATDEDGCSFAVYRPVGK